MYYLRVYNYEINGFGFVVEGIHDILPTDISISNEDYELFFKEYNGRSFKVRDIKSNNLFELLEECHIEPIIYSTDENNMTLYYYKSDGTIYSCCTGINDLSTFGEHKKDYELILDYVVLPLDKYVLDNIKYFAVDIESKELYMKSSPGNYTIR